MPLNFLISMSFPFTLSPSSSVSVNLCHFTRLRGPGIRDFCNSIDEVWNGADRCILKIQSLDRRRELRGLRGLIGPRELRRLQEVRDGAEKVILEVQPPDAFHP